MTGKIRESGQMIDFIRSRYEAQEHAIVAKIRPLPVDVLPSKQFVSETRVQLLRLIAGESASRKAA